MKRKIKWGGLIIILAALLLSVFLYVQSQPPQQSGDSLQNAADEIIFQATKETLSNSIEVKGKSSYVRETTLYAPFTAEVNDWYVENGQQVIAGEPLFRLAAEQELRQVELEELRIAEEELAHRLLEASARINASEIDGSDPFTQFSSAEKNKLDKKLTAARLEIARKSLDDRKERLSKQQFPAPVSGIFLFTGEVAPSAVEQDSPIGIIVDLSELQLITEVTEFEVFNIKEGMEADIRIDALRDKRIKGTVKSVAKFAKSGTDKQSGPARFEVTLSLTGHDNLIAGLSLTGKIITEQKVDAIVIPTIAVMQEDNQSYVYVKEAGGVSRRNVQIGLETAEKTEILNGLVEGETVVLR